MAQKTYVVFQPPHHHNNDNDDDDFQDSCRSSLPPKPRPQSQPLKPSPSANTVRPSKRPKPPLGLGSSFPSKPATTPHHFEPDFTTNHAFPSQEEDCSLDSIESTLGSGNPPHNTVVSIARDSAFSDLNRKGVYSSNSLEARLLTSIVNPAPSDYSDNNGTLDNGNNSSDEFEPCTQLDVLIKLCSDENEGDGHSNGIDFAHHQEHCFNNSPVCCPLCGNDISDLTDELRQVHTNDCLDKDETTLNLVCPNEDVQPRCYGQVVDGSPIKSPRQIADISPVLEWLRGLGLARYEEIFVQEEIDWDTLQWLTEEDLFSIGVTALGPRKKIVQSLSELKKESSKTTEIRTNASRDVTDETSRVAVSKLITDYFLGSVGHRKKDCTPSSGQREIEKSHSDARRKQIVVKKNVTNGKLRDIPQWCCIPGTPFRVDAFKYLRRDCSHWFLTHFHMDHYQGLTRSFSHGKIYCSLITARLVNMKIGIPWDELQVLPLNQKICIAGIDVTCFDANHCPGSIILLFEPPNGKAVLHTGDFRFCEEMAKIPVLQMCSVQTLILDTTYCNPQYDFPKQEAVIQFVVEAIQAEAFNPKTLFLIGSYTIGKERLFLEVARVLRKKVYVTAAKLRLLECLGLSMEDMQWFTLNQRESHIHVVPMWTLASIKRLKCISNQYARQYSLIVAFTPSGWTFGKGKKSSGRRWQQGTIVRYEVPYSEHCSFTELKEFVKFIYPENIIPSVNNDGPESANAMISLLLS